MAETPLFNKAWEEAKVRIFRLEALPQYNAPEKGRKNFEEAGEWLNNLDKAKEKCLAIHRIRVFILPISDYLKYQIDLWKISKNSGEQTLFLEEEKYKKTIEGLDFKPQDFWLFDDKLVIIFHCDTKGNFLEEELVIEKEAVSKYVELRKKLMENSLSMTPFLYRVKRL